MQRACTARAKGTVRGPITTCSTQPRVRAMTGFVAAAHRGAPGVLRGRSLTLLQPQLPRGFFLAGVADLAKHAVRFHRARSRSNCPVSSTPALQGPGLVERQISPP